MAPTHIRSILFFCLLAVVCSTLLPTGNVHALTPTAYSPDLPSLSLFVEQVSNGQVDQLRGVYIPGMLAASIVQQPKSKEEFISPWKNIVTEFSLASKFGSTGLLAHNYLAGRSFSALESGSEFYLVYGNGQISTFTVSEIFRYQALDSNSTSSAFVNLENGNIINHQNLFEEMYNRPGNVILQTCIDAENNPTWGRLFIIAKPKD